MYILLLPRLRTFVDRIRDKGLGGLGVQNGDGGMGMAGGGNVDIANNVGEGGDGEAIDGKELVNERREGGGVEENAKRKKDMDSGVVGVKTTRTTSTYSTSSSSQQYLTREVLIVYLPLGTNSSKAYKKIYERLRR